MVGGVFSIIIRMYITRLFRFALYLRVANSGGFMSGPAHTTFLENVFASWLDKMKKN